jgi:hypothetical protein
MPHNAESDPTSPANEPHTTERHAALMAVWMGDKGLLIHRYRRCGFSGSGNCCCGRALESTLHPHTFTRSYVARQQDAWRCVCSKPANHEIHGTSAP